MSEEPTAYIVVLCTAPDQQAARLIGERLVERRLAACVNIVPGLASVYRWEGAVHEDAETLLVIKTRRDLFDEVAADIAAAHPYRVPEIIALPVVRGSASYLDWLAAETKTIP